MEGEQNFRVNNDGTGHFKNKYGQHIFSKYWHPSSATGVTATRALVFIAHGAGEHCLWYDHVAKPLTEKDMLVFSHDHVGHGQSEGDRVHIDDVDKYVDDVFLHIDFMCEKYPDLPVFIMGHSMGGTIAIRAAMRKPDFFRGVVLIAPGIAPNPATATPFRLFLARWVAWLIPQFEIEKIKPIYTCRDKEVVKRYEEDPLVYHGGLKARWAVSMLTMMDKIQSEIPNIKWPFLILHGDLDKLTLIDGSKKLAEGAASTDKTFKLYEGAYHQLHGEPDGLGEEVKQLMASWIDQRIK